MTALDTKAIRARADAATAGPWRAGSHDTWLVFGDIGNPDCMAPVLGRVVAHINQHFPHAADAAFIAAAREDVPALCARVEALEAALREAVAELECEELELAVAKARAALEGAP